MRVLHINCNYIGTTLHQTMVEELSRQGNENEVFVPTYDKRIAVIKPNENVCVSECFHKWDRLVFDYKQKKIIKAIEARYDIRSFDLIHAYTVFTDGNVARMLSKKYGIPFVVAVRNTDVNDFFRIMVPLRSRGVQIMKDAKAVFFLSNAYKNQVFGRYIPAKDKESIERKTHIIPNGIDDFWHNNLFTSRDYEEILTRLSQKKLRIVYAGAIDRNKNITLICDAVDLLREEGWEITFTVVGKIKDKIIFDSIKNRISYISPQPKETLIEIYRDADIFVMVSHTETFGLVYAEAMSQGLPVIYTRGQGFDGQFAEGEVGYSALDNDCQHLCKAILQIVNDYQRLSTAALIKTIKFEWANIGKKYLNIYDVIDSAK